MKNIFFLSFLCLSLATFSQVITGEELQIMVESAQKSSVGAHESIVLRTNENFAKTMWGKKVRLNETSVIKYFSYPSGEKVVAGVDVNMSKGKQWRSLYDPKSVATLLLENGVRVTQSYDKLTINAKQDLILAENETDSTKIVLELYCPQEKFLEVLRIGQTQSIEFLITGCWGSTSTDTKIHGVLTQVNGEKPIIKCSNRHEFDKDAGYKFCPTCGKPLS
jgi:hypothetical protein